ncbi:transcriptional regulator [Aquincola tertiaricarbonis]|uniref:Transcriptional regulator n=1 Tax=Aquincola tertiaricarbonis TaxID=391953 RepID=A0ABY4SGW7_AQUTE|nr:transcriptional regulator [Aquincola tertiaricarbonis]URI11142.1 transcriptional regulator [Aquincola tertiaricarbonis]
MRTVAETPLFVQYAADVWSDNERLAFISWIAANAESGDLIPGSGGCRKVRWSTAGTGKRGGARIIYFLEREHTIWLLIVYKKARFDNLPTEFLAELRKGVEDVL